MKKIALTLAGLLVTTFVLAGCNTMAGFGQDISDTGQSIHNSAEKHKNQ